MLKHAPLLFVLLCGAILFGINVWGYDLWAPDEPRFAEVAREVMQTGDWIVMHVNGEPYYEKPPLMFWTIALLSFPFGDVTELTARLPSVLGGLMTLLLTFLLAERLYGKRVALASSVILMTMSLFWWEARTAQIDMFLTAWTTLSLFAFWRHHETRETKWLLVFYGAIVAAVYAKGPPGIVFPLLLAFTFYWRQREKRRSLHLVLGVLVVAVLIGLWLIPAYSMASTQEARPEIAQDTSVGLVLDNLYRQTIGRFVLGVSKKQPPWYFLANLPVNVFPWTLFLPWTLYAVWKRRHEGAPMRLLLSWTLPAFVFFSISSGKRTIYLLPLYPAFAILFGTTLVELAENDRTQWRRITGYVWAAILLTLGSLTFPLGYVAATGNTRFVERVSHAYAVELPFASPGIVGAAWALLPFCLCALAFGIHAIVRTRRAEGRTLYYAVAGHFAGLAVVAAISVFPFIDTFKGASDFCAPLRDLSERGDTYRLFSVAFSRESYIFYAKHHHIPFLVEEWPLPVPEGRDPLEVAMEQRAMGNMLRKGVKEVNVANVQAVTDKELAQLTDAADAAFAFAKAKSNLVDSFRAAVTKAVKAFDDDFHGPEPSFLFVQAEDWLWLLTFDPNLRDLPILAHESVGSRQVLLIANAAGMRLVENAGITPIPSQNSSYLQRKTIDNPREL